MIPAFNLKIFHVHLKPFLSVTIKHSCVTVRFTVNLKRCSMMSLLAAFIKLAQYQAPPPG